MALLCLVPLPVGMGLFLGQRLAVGRGPAGVPQRVWAPRQVEPVWRSCGAGEAPDPPARPDGSSPGHAAPIGNWLGAWE